MLPSNPVDLFFSGYWRQGTELARGEGFLLIFCLWSAPCTLANTFTETRTIDTLYDRQYCITQGALLFTLYLN